MSLRFFFLGKPPILLIEEILHQLIGSLSHYFQGFVHARWLFGISSVNSMKELHPRKLTWIPKIAMFERRYIFQTIIFGIEPLVFGGVVSLLKRKAY